MTSPQKEQAAGGRPGSELNSIHGSKRRCKYNTREEFRQSFTSVNYPRRLGEFYCEVKSASHAGLARGIAADDVGGVVTTFGLSNRRGLDALDAWAAIMDAHRAAVLEAMA